MLEWVDIQPRSTYIDTRRTQERASLSLVAEWVKKSFDSISTDAIITGFHKTLLEGFSDDDILEDINIDDLNSTFQFNESRGLVD